MNLKQLYDFLFSLYDYADYLADNISPENMDNNSYFMSLIYIEEMMDSYGRGLIHRTALSINASDTESLAEAHRRIDLLRKRIRDLRSRYDFNGTSSGKDVVQYKLEKITRDYGKRL
jgi:hypothetical protein